MEGLTCYTSWVLSWSWYFPFVPCFWFRTFPGLGSSGVCHPQMAIFLIDMNGCLSQSTTCDGTFSILMSMSKHKALCWSTIISNIRYLWCDDEAATKYTQNDMKQTKSLLPICSRVWRITHWGRDKVDAISKTTFSSAFSRMKIFEFRLKFHWGLFLEDQLMIFQHWFR